MKIVPRVTFKHDCGGFRESHPLLLGIFEAGNTYDVPAELAYLFQSNGWLVDASQPLPPASHTLDVQSVRAASTSEVK